jgi:soluble lytic murein transglycosylase-like protein
MFISKWVAAAAFAGFGVNAPQQPGEVDVAAAMRGLDSCILMSAPVRQLDAEAGKYSRMVEKASRANGVEGALVLAVIRAESSYNPNAVSSAGASGLMQLMPETAKRYGVRDIFDPAQNIQGGVRHLKDLLVMFDGDIELAIAAYNAGPYAVIRAGNRIPRQPQTLAYVPKVIGYYRDFASTFSFHRFHERS